MTKSRKVAWVVLGVVAMVGCVRSAERSSSSVAARTKVIHAEEADQVVGAIPYRSWKTVLTDTELPHGPMVALVDRGDGSVEKVAEKEYFRGEVVRFTKWSRGKILIQYRCQDDDANPIDPEYRTSPPWWWGVTDAKAVSPEDEWWWPYEKRRNR